MKKPARQSKNERGQSLVEMAISLVFIVFLLSGAVEFGIAFFQFVQLRDAVQEGALFASVNPADSAGIVSRVQQASNSPIDLTTLTPAITYSGAPCEGNGVTVTLSFDHEVFMPFLSVITGGTIPLTATVTDTILTPVCP